MQFWHMDRYMDQWNRTESSEINPYTYGKLTFDKGNQVHQWGERISLQ